MSKNAPPPYSAAPPEPGFYPPPPPHHHHHGPPPPEGQNVQHTVIVTTTTHGLVGSEPTRMVCPSCHANIVTQVENEPSTKTHLFAFLLCLFGCYPCCCIPYCMDSCQSQKHTCPNCGSYLGSFSN